MNERIPVMEEHVRIDKRTIETGTVQIRKTVVERQEEIAVPVLRHTADIRRVRCNRVVDQPVATRQEGDVTILSLHEERSVVVKQWVLIEELHISTRTSEVLGSQQVTLRREDIEIERTSADATGGANSTEQ